MGPLKWWAPGQCPIAHMASPPLPILHCVCTRVAVQKDVHTYAEPYHSDKGWRGVLPPLDSEHGPIETLVLLQHSHKFHWPVARQIAHLRYTIPSFHLYAWMFMRPVANQFNNATN